jgi:hypothetical protein
MIADLTVPQKGNGVGYSPGPLPDDCSHLIRIEGLEVARFATRARYVLVIGLRDAPASASFYGVRDARPKNPRETHGIGEHPIYVGVYGHSLAIRRLLPTVPIPERSEGSWMSPNVLAELAPILRNGGRWWYVHEDEDQCKM